MSIDWLTVIAQLLNFMILVGLLKHFLYRPILDGIDAREQEIATRMGEAANIMSEAKAAHREYQHKIAHLEQQQSDTLASAKAATERERDAMLYETRQRIEQEEQAAQQHRQRQAQQYIHDLNDQAGTALLAVTQKALNDMSDEQLEERLVMHALTTLQQNASQQSTRQKTKKDSITAQVCTREPLSAPCRTRLQTSAAKHWPELILAFTNNPEQSPGALVQLESLQVDWTIDTYVSELAAALTHKLLPAIEPRL